MEHINLSLASIDRVTQENASMAEEVARNADGLTQQASTLLQLLSSIHTNEQSDPNPPARPILVANRDAA